MNVYVSAGRVTSDCAQCGRLRIHVVGSVALCPACYAVATVTQPSTISDAMTILSMRPDPITRNWRPDLGETVNDLERENAAHGLV